MKRSMLLLVCGAFVAVFTLASAETRVTFAEVMAPGEPVDVGPAGIDDEGEADIPTSVCFKIQVAGAVAFAVKNTSGQTVTDVHVKPYAPAVSRFEITAIDFSHDTGTVGEFTEETLSGEVNGEASEAQPDPAGGTGLTDDDTGTIGFDCVDANGDPIAIGVTIYFQVWWTRGANRNIPVARYGKSGFGDTDPRTTVASAVPGIDTVESEVSASTIEFAGSPVAVTCPDIPLGECDGYQFQDGSLVLSSVSPVPFDITSDTEISAYDTDGGDVPLSDISFSNLRIDDAGNFVFDISRDSGVADAILIVITGLDILFTEDVTWATGAIVTAGVSGSAVAGVCAESIWDLVEITS